MTGGLSHLDAFHTFCAWRPFAPGGLSRLEAFRLPIHSLVVHWCRQLVRSGIKTKRYIMNKHLHGRLIEGGAYFKVNSFRGGTYWREGAYLND